MIRFFDITFATIALILLSPLFVLVIMVLSLTGEREVFYKQKRIGFKKTQFNLFKFATMLKDSPNIGTGTITLENDPRVLPIGKFLRSTKINELPQLINILRGDMSMIGPRPLTIETFSMYSERVQNEIIKCRPGLSGVGSIVFRDEQSLLNNGEDPVKFYTEKIAPCKGELETWFVNNRNLMLYFTLIFCTICVLFLKNTNLIWRLYPSLPKFDHK